MEKLPEAKAPENLRQTLFLHGPVIWKVMKRSAWKDIVNWRINKTTVVPLERNLYWQGLLWDGQFEKVQLDHGWEKFSTGNVYLSTEQEDHSYQCMWTMSNWQARQKTWNRLGKF